MNIIFEFTDKHKIYDKCIYASIAHSVMVGKYTLLTSEISWDDKNYLFQNMEGIRGVISFADNKIICGIQDEENNILGEKNIEKNLLYDASFDIINIAKEEIFPYLLVVTDNDNIPATTTMFWEENGKMCSDLSEKELMKKSNSILLPYLYEENDMKRFWRDYYEMDQEQEKIIEELYQLKRINKTFVLDSVKKEKLCNWFDDKFIYCKQSMEEMGIIID